MKVMKTNPDLWSQLISQMESQTEVGSGSRTGVGEAGSGSHSGSGEADFERTRLAWGVAMKAREPKMISMMTRGSEVYLYGLFCTR